VADGPGGLTGSAGRNVIGGPEGVAGAVVTIGGRPVASLHTEFPSRSAVEF
jgi:hypothetical protein